MPIGNKQQQSKAPLPAESQAAEEARKLGLTWMRYGRWGKNGHITHFTVHGRLVEKRKALTPPKVAQVPGAAGKSKHPKVAPTMQKPGTPGYKEFMGKVAPINEAFEALMAEDERRVTKLDFREFRKTLNEGEPVTEPNTEPGPILGGGPAETNSMSSGGLATSVPKKTFSSLRKKKTP
jgi:hypothetical protein